MKLLVFLDNLACAGCRNLGIVRCVLRNLEAGFVGHIVLQNIENEAFLNGLMHAVDMERPEAAIRHGHAEHLQRGILRGCREGKERQIAVLSMGNKLPDQLVLRVNPVFGNALNFRILPEGGADISQRGLELQRTAAGLGGMGFVTDNGKVPTVGSVDLLINDRELLQRGHDDARAIIDGILQILRVLAFADGLHGAQRVVKAGDGRLQLCVQHGTVGDDDDTAEDRLVLTVVQGSQAISRPGNGIGLAGTG